MWFFFFYLIEKKKDCMIVVIWECIGSCIVFEFLWIFICFGFEF